MVMQKEAPMPYLDKAKSRECWMRWYRRNKKKYISRKLIRDKAQRKYPIARKCGIEGCDNVGERHHQNYSKPLEIFWLCKIHHGQVHRKSCQISRCTNEHIAMNFCMYHYNQNRRGGIK